jgi:tetratricopeptide (TPR) repeat protein
MAKVTRRRRVALESPDDMLTQASRLWGYIRPYAHWLAVAVVIVAVGFGIWGINSWMHANREAKAVAALGRVSPPADLQAPNAEAAAALEKFIQKYSGTGAAREALLLRANLLYKLKNYQAAAAAYQSLLSAGHPGWDTLVNESLSYCYEALGEFKKAAATLKPVADQTSGPMKTDVIRRLALLYDQAQEPKEAAVYWRQLVDQPPNPALAPYFQQKLAAAEAKEKK